MRSIVSIYAVIRPGWRLTGEDFWKWKREIYDVQRWTQSRDYYNELKEQREREQQRATEGEAEERRKTAEAEAQHRKGAEEAAEEQRREEQRKQASREKRRVQGKGGSKESKLELRLQPKRQRHRNENAKRKDAVDVAGSKRCSRSREPRPRPGGRLEEALKIMGLTVDILRLSSKEAVTVIKNRFRTLAMKFHPDRGGDANKFMSMTEAYEYLLWRCTE